MDLDFRVTDIANIIYVDKTEYSVSDSTFEHVLEHYELIYKISGEMVLYFGNSVTKLSSGMIYILPQGNNKRYRVERIVAGDCIDIFFDCDRKFSSEVFVQNVSDNKQIETLFKHIFSVWVAKNEGYYFECLSIIYQIFAQMQKKQYVSRDKMNLIRPAVDYIHENFMTKKKMDCTCLSNLCGISYSYLKQIFLRQYNMPPHQYIMRLKLNYACDLLMQHSYSVGQAAEMAGFEDIYYFSRVFKKQMGIPPSEYILKCRSSKG